MNLQPGELDRRVTLQSATITRDGTGGQVKLWADEATVWAKVAQERGRESVEGKDVVQGQSLRVITWYYPGLSDAWQLVYNGNAHRITSVQESGRGQWHIIHCERKGERTSG